LCISSSTACPADTNSQTQIPNGCSNILSYSSHSGYQPETNGIKFDASPGQVTTGCENSYWDYIGGTVAGIATIIATAKILKLDLGDEKQNQNDITDSLEKGIKWGFMTCVLPRLVGDIGGWMAPSGSSADNAFNKVSAVGKGMANTCNAALGMMPLIMQFIQFYISYLQFQACMDMVQSQIESSAYYASNAPGVYGAVGEANTAASTMNSMMTCFSTLADAFSRVSYSMSYMQNSINTFTGSMGITYKLDNVDLGNSRTLDHAGNFQAIATNVCSGTGQAGIEITGTDAPGKTCKSHSGPISCNAYPSYSSSYYSPYVSSSYSPGMMMQQNQQSLPPTTLDLKNCASGNIQVVVTGRGVSTETFTFTKPAG
jgi:hypothetical protein